MTPLIQSVDWVAVAPPLVLALVGLAALVADLFLAEARKPLLGWLSVAGLVLAGFTLLPLVGEKRTTFCLTEGTGECGYVADRFTLLIQLLVIGGALLTALLSLPTVRKAGMPVGEFWFLLLSSAAGAALLPASRDLATLVVALEVVSLPSFALVGLRRGDRLSSEAALKFFLSSVTATAVMLLGVSFVYAATGSLHLGSIADGLDSLEGPLVTLAHVGTVLTLVGFAFKLAVVPFHFWVPDTYVGAPLPVAAYLSAVGKAAGLSGLILLTVIAFRPYDDIWGPVLAVLAAATMTAGNVAALRQRADSPYSAVRLLAWSSVSQAGWLLAPLAAAGYTVRGETADPAEMVGTTVAYALMYTVVNLGAFAVAVLVAGGSPGNRLADYRALFTKHPLGAVTLGFSLLCLAGLPPGVIGLFAKVMVFRTAVDTALGWLAVIMAINVVIGLFYYLKWIASLFARPDGEAERAATPKTASVATPSSLAASPLDTASAPPVASETPLTRQGAVTPRLPTPLPLTIAMVVTLLLAVALSAAPQLVLRFAMGTVF